MNPYDPKSPVNYLPDPLVKVFDLRMRRQLTPMSMSTSSPSFLRHVPHAHQPGVGAGVGECVLLGSTSGILQVSPTAAEMDPAATQILYAPLQERKEQVTSAAISKTGHFMCVGTSSGTIAQYVIGLPAARPKVSHASTPLVIPPYPAPAPPVSVSPRALALAGSYVTRPADPASAQHAALSMASSYQSTPAARTRRLRLTSARRLSDEMAGKTQQQDFIGTVPNPGFRGNSMLYGVAAKRAYAVCDPRKRLAEQQQQQAKGEAEGERGEDGGAGRQASGGGHSSAAGAGAGAGTGVGAGSGAGTGYASSIPASVRKIHSHRGKQVCTIGILVYSRMFVGMLFSSTSFRVEVLLFDGDRFRANLRIEKWARGGIGDYKHILWWRSAPLARSLARGPNRARRDVVMTPAI